MRRRAEPGLLEVAAQAPWWVGVALAALAYLLLGTVLPAMLQASPYTLGLAVVAATFAPYAALVFLGAAAVSVVSRRRRRALLDAQKDLDSIRALTWQQFEQLVAEAFSRQGFRVEVAGGGGPDGGVDLRLRRNGQLTLVQCKRWRTATVGVTVVRELAGVKAHEKAHAASVVSSGRFTSEAQTFAQAAGIELVDGPALVRLVQSVNTRPSDAIPPAAEASPTAQPGDPVPACPRCQAPMTKRQARRGHHAGRAFWGCSRFPDCRGLRTG